MNKNDEITVFLMKKDGKRNNVGKIKKTINSNTNINRSNKNIESLYEFNKYVLDYIKKDIPHTRFNLADNQTFNVFFIGENIIGIIFYRVKLSNEIIYYVFQKSSAEHRFLCYIVPLVEGSQQYKINDAYLDISQELPYLLKRLEKFKSIYPFFESISKFNKNKIKNIF